ncbi:MAG: diacylglycerol kinase family lipid kinase [Alphaproteobacteria bacterium]|jgi:YegS/Rv2252/BmrU family lipid kinase|nr:diacylglycerol kinase family lipid kinase [Alphaproteobacteria bacterium]
MSTFAIINPRSANSHTARAWPDIERGLRHLYPQMNVGFTRARGHATALVRAALAEGYTEIVAVGGDGTINEAVNGFFDPSGPLAPEATFAFVSSGTGGDFRKTFDIAPGTMAGIERLKGSHVRPVDIGRVTCLGMDGTPAVRHFINIASFGLPGVIVDAVNRARIAKLFGGGFAFAFHSMVNMAFYRDRVVRLHIDDVYDEIDKVSTVAIANGRYFGGGMKVAPDAKPDDGAFDIIVMGGAAKLRALSDFRQLYDGSHVNNPTVRVVRGKKLVAAPVSETKGRAVLIETDGENAGRLPATFEILPRALNLRC